MNGNWDYVPAVNLPLMPGPLGKSRPWCFKHDSQTRPEGRVRCYGAWPDDVCRIGTIQYYEYPPAPKEEKRVCCEHCDCR